MAFQLSLIYVNQIISLGVVNVAVSPFPKGVYIFLPFPFTIVFTPLSTERIIQYICPLCGFAGSVNVTAAVTSI